MDLAEAILQDFAVPFRNNKRKGKKKDKERKKERKKEKKPSQFSLL